VPTLLTDNLAEISRLSRMSSRRFSASPEGARKTCLSARRVPEDPRLKMLFSKSPHGSSAGGKQGLQLRRARAAQLLTTCEWQTKYRGQSVRRGPYRGASAPCSLPAAVAPRVANPRRIEPGSGYVLQAPKGFKFQVMGNQTRCAAHY